MLFLEELISDNRPQFASIFAATLLSFIYFVIWKNLHSGQGTVRTSRQRKSFPGSEKGDLDPSYTWRFSLATKPNQNNKNAGVTSKLYPTVMTICHCFTKSPVSYSVENK
ncbi:hypothetical protein NPIL_538341, partial [Nephila pilipes]